MADRELQIVLSLKDEASRQLKGFQGKLKDLQPTFKKMATVGVASLGALTLGINETIQEAATAEGAMAKFRTVFADSTDEMLDFVNELRKEMPSATSDIIAMAAGLQDLLVPMGLNRDKAKELSKQTLDLANKIAAFNDVDPSRVLEAFRSGLVGSSEPLRAFGIDARVAALEATALEAGLLEAGQGFADLEPSIASAVQAEALLIQATKQSADAINGFEENNDSFIRRQQDLNATIKETKEAIGKAFLPAIDGAIKKIGPIVKKIADWAEKNPELLQQIVLIAGAIAGLLTVIGGLGLVLPAIITGFTLLAGAVAFLLSPIGLIILAIGALIAIIVLIVLKWEFVKTKTIEIWTAISEFLSNVWATIKEKVMSAWEAIKGVITTVLDAIKIVFQFWVAFVLGLIVSFLDTVFPKWRETWQAISDFFRFIWEELKIFIQETLLLISTVWNETWQSMIDFFMPMWESVKTVIKTGIDFVMGIFNKAKEPIVGAWQSLWDAVKGVAQSAGEVIKNVVRNVINFIIDKINSFINKINEIKNKAGKFGKGLPDIPNIPRLAKGGIVTAPTVAEIGEAGPEAVIPLNKAGMLGTTINITINGDVSGEELVQKVRDGIMDDLRPNTKLNFI